MLFSLSSIKTNITLPTYSVEMEQTQDNNFPIQQQTDSKMIYTATQLYRTQTDWQLILVHKITVNI